MMFLNNEKSINMPIVFSLIIYASSLCLLNLNIVLDPFLFVLDNPLHIVERTHTHRSNLTGGYDRDENTSTYLFFHLLPFWSSDTPCLKEKCVTDTTDTTCLKEKCIDGAPSLKEKYVGDALCVKEKCVGDAPCLKEKCVGDTPCIKKKRVGDAPFLKEKCAGDCERLQYSVQLMQEVFHFE